MWEMHTRGPELPILVDSHCHLDVEDFDADRDAAVARARAAGVVAQIIPAISARSWPAIRALCSRHTGLYAAYGLHPVALDQHQPQDLQKLDAWLDQHPAVAVGETGLDFHVPGLDPQAQRELLDGHLEIARARQLPAILHARKAVDAVIQMIRRHPGVRGVVHSYGGSIEQAQQLQRLGFMIGIGGPITYPRGSRLRSLVAALPITQLLLETDAPDQPLRGFQGQRNEPARLPLVLAAVAAARNCDPRGLARACCANAETLFGPLGLEDANSAEPTSAPTPGRTDHQA